MFTVCWLVFALEKLVKSVKCERKAETTDWMMSMTKKIELMDDFPLFPEPYSREKRLSDLRLAFFPANKHQIKSENAAKWQSI